jgi:hypothetical protein
MSMHVRVRLQGKRHQQNLAKRAAREAAEKQVTPAPQKRAAVKKSGAQSHFQLPQLLLAPLRDGNR